MIVLDTHAWIIIATTQSHGGLLITADSIIQQYPDLRWAWGTPP